MAEADCSATILTRRLQSAGAAWPPQRHVQVPQQLQGAAAWSVASRAEAHSPGPPSGSPAQVVATLNLCDGGSPGYVYCAHNTAAHGLFYMIN